MPPLKKFLLKFIGKKAEYRNETFDDSQKNIDFVAQKLSNLNHDEITAVYIYDIVPKVDYMIKSQRKINVLPEYKEL